MNHGRTCLVTPTKVLEDAIMADHGNVGIVNIRGKDNYQCSYRPGWSCKDGYAGGCPIREEEACGYTGTYLKAKAARIVLTNTKFWLAIHKYGSGLGVFDNVVFDEADTLPEDLADSVQIAVSFRETEEILELGFPSANSSGIQWKSWASVARKRAMEKATEKKAQIEGSRSPKPTWIKDLHHLKSMVQKLAMLSLMNPNDWVWEEFEWGWQFDPVKFHRYSESRMFLKVPSVSLYSATIRPKSMHMMGIGDDKFDFLDHPSVFDPSRSTISHVPSMAVDRRTEHDISVLIMRMDQIGVPRLALGRNGVVNVTSFTYRDRVVKMSDMRASIVTHWDKSPVADAIKRFRDQGGVLVSPSVGTGNDFKDDQCRFLFMLKVPFIPRTKVVMAREAADKYYSPYQVARKLGQGVGRGNRGQDDWCENFILDDHFPWFYNRYHYFFSKSFKERLRWQDRVPPVYYPPK
jgi:ATP-dependent DNA helicase DinG